MEYEEEKKRLGAIMQRIGKMRPDLSVDGISHFEYMLLCAIGRTGMEEYVQTKEKAQVSFLAKDLCVAPPAVSRSLKTLETKGFIMRSTDKEDRRNTRVSLTEDGCELYHQIKEKLDYHMKCIIQEFGKENVDQMIQLTERFLDAVENEMKDMREANKHEADF